MTNRSRLRAIFTAMIFAAAVPPLWAVDPNPTGAWSETPDPLLALLAPETPSTPPEDFIEAPQPNIKPVPWTTAVLGMSNEALFAAEPVPAQYAARAPYGTVEPDYPPATVRIFGHEWLMDVFGSAAFGDSKGQLYSGHLSLETPLWRRLDIAVQPFGGVGLGEEDVTGVFGLDLLLKYPLLTGHKTEINFEGGGGVQQAGPKSWPDEGSHFNFRTLLGVGLEYETVPYKHLLLGGRWLHVSNAGIHPDQNPGVNDIMLYAGFRVSF